MELIKRPKDNYVYIHYNGIDAKYVGRGTGRRVLEHHYRNNYEWDSYRIVAEGLSREESFELETLIVQTIGYENLSNVKRNQNMTEEHKRKIGEATRGRKRPDVALRNKMRAKT